MIQKPILLSSFLFLYIRALLHSIHPYIRTSVHLYTKKITSYNFLGVPFKWSAARCDKNLKARLSLDYVLFQVMVPFPPFSLEPERRWAALWRPRSSPGKFTTRLEVVWCPLGLQGHASWMCSQLDWHFKCQLEGRETEGNATEGTDVVS